MTAVGCVSLVISAGGVGLDSFTELLDYFEKVTNRDKTKQMMSYL